MSGVAPPPPGWYPDPGGTAAQRYWDGQSWTQQTQNPPGSMGAIPEASRQWAMAAHLSSLVGLLGGVFCFLGPLIIYLVKQDDPWVRREAAESLNFQLSVLIYGLVGFFITFVLMFAIVGFLLIPVWIGAVAAFLVVVIVAGVKASRGEPYRYPITIRFVSS